jgi:exopolysaccharide biosynthesis polyprenyl glycosylphosphotransferase
LESEIVVASARHGEQKKRIRDYESDAVSVTDMSTEAGESAGVVESPAIPLRNPSSVIVPTSGRRKRRVAAGSRSMMLQGGLVIADVCALAVSAGLALILASPADPAPGQLALSLLFLPVSLMLFKLYGLYDGERKRLSHSTLDDVPSVFHASLVATIGLWWTLKAASSDPLALRQAPLLLGLTVALVLVARAVVRALTPRLLRPERVLLVGGGPGVDQLLAKIGAYGLGRLHPAGYLCDEGQRRDGIETALAYLGKPEDIAVICTAYEVERVMIDSPAIEPQRLTALVREANRSNVKVTLLPSANDVLGPATEIDELHGLTLLSVNPAHFTRSSRLLKRSLDVTLSALALIAFLPLLPLVALAIKLDSPGPVFFRQKRLGRGGRIFEVVKLRTMAQDAEDRVLELQTQSTDPAWLQLDHDPRITSVGRLLRLTSIDELPQLWNVLRGEMSLVGPRPMPLLTGEHINGWAHRRHDLTPGITGMWQVFGRASLPFEEMIKLDYLYVINWSVWGDVRLLLRTVSVVLARRGAN